MRSKPSLTLMELLVMVLIFAMASAACLRIFAHAHRISRETARRDEAVQLAQNTAERLKAGLPPEETGDYEVEVQRQESGLPGLAQARITVFYEGEALFFLNAGWQEELP